MKSKANEHRGTRNEMINGYEACIGLNVDMDGKPLEIGQRILYPTGTSGDQMKPGIRRGKITAISEKPTHRGYGYWTHTLRIEDELTGTEFRHNFPQNCLIHP